MEEIEFNENVQPACLPQSCADECPEDSDVLIAGWGSSVYGGNSPSETLQKAKIPIVPRATCNELYDGSSIVSDHTTCVGYVGNVPVVPCYHDMGGGMMCYRNGYFQLDAIMFNFQSCGYPELPAIFKRVCVALDWIDSTIG